MYNDMENTEDVLFQLTALINKFLSDSLSKECDVRQVLPLSECSVSTETLVQPLQTLISQLKLVHEKMMRRTQKQAASTDDSCIIDSLENYEVRSESGSVVNLGRTEGDTRQNNMMSESGSVVNLGRTERDTRQNNVMSHPRDTKPERATDTTTGIVQIKASKSEIERRITAFKEKKQKEVNQLNNREFCSIFTQDTDVDDSCARTDAVFVPRAGCKSHIKVSRVVNPYGPQTRLKSCDAMKLVGSSKDSAGVEERIHNIESHLGLQEAGHQKTDIFERLKSLENRILFLEGISPEYFKYVPPPKKSKIQLFKPPGGDNDAQMHYFLSGMDKGECLPSDGDQCVEDCLIKHLCRPDVSVEELDDRIHSLQEALKRKKRDTTYWLH